MGSSSAGLLAGAWSLAMRKPVGELPSFAVSDGCSIKNQISEGEVGWVLCYLGNGVASHGSGEQPSESSNEVNDRRRRVFASDEASATVDLQRHVDFPAVTDSRNRASSVTTICSGESCM